MMRKKSALILFVVCAFLSACGQRGGGRNPASEQTRNLGQIIDGGEELSPQEEDMATDICYALKSKRNEMNNLFFASEHKMELTTKKCDGSKIEKTVDVKIAEDSQNLHFSTFNSEALLRMSEILTDRSAGLSDICEAILNGETPTNTSNVDSDLIVRTHFFREGEERTVRLEHASRSFSNTGEVIHTVTHVEDYVFGLDEKFGPLPVGTIRESVYTSQCPNGSEADHIEYQQNLIP